MYIINVDKLIEIFLDCDDFCKNFEPVFQRAQIHRGRTGHNKPKLHASEIMTILIFYHFSGMKCFKYYYNRIVCDAMLSYFPNVVSYNRFVELIPRHMLHLCVFLNTVRIAKQTGIAYIDSKKLPICHNRRIYSNKVFKGLATRGHCSVGWFYGFKLFLVINHLGQVLRCFITPANIADNDQKIMHKLLNGFIGKIFGDKGFISSKILEEYIYKRLQIITKLRKNMKNKLINIHDYFLLTKRGVIESVFDIMSAICDIDHSRHRSPVNAFTHLFSGVIAYTYLDKLPSIFRNKYAEIHPF